MECGARSYIVEIPKEIFDCLGISNPVVEVLAKYNGGAVSVTVSWEYEDEEVNEKEAIEKAVDDLATALALADAWGVNLEKLEEFKRFAEEWRGAVKVYLDRICCGYAVFAEAESGATRSVSISVPAPPSEPRKEWERFKRRQRFLRTIILCQLREAPSKARPPRSPSSFFVEGLRPSSL